MGALKNITFALIPFHSDIRRNEQGKIYAQKEWKFVVTKRVILGGLGLTTVVLAIITALAFTGILPTGALGNTLLIAGTCASFGTTAFYLFGLGAGRYRSHLIRKGD